VGGAAEGAGGLRRAPAGEPLLDRAAGLSISIGLSPGGLPSELPDLDEVRRTLDEFRGAPLVLWADLLRVARCRRTGGPGAGAFTGGGLRALLAGVEVEDGDRERDGLPLGSGEVDLEAWSAFRTAPAPGGKTETAGTAAALGAGGAGAPAVPPSPADAVREALRSPAGPERRPAAWVIDLDPAAGLDDVLATRRKLEEFLEPPPPPAGPFDILGSTRG